MEARTYTIKEAAVLTRLSVDSIRDAVKSGKLPAIKPGGKWLVLKAPLDRLLNGETAA